MEENPKSDILTKVVLTEKVPFLVDIFYDNISHEDDNYCGTFLVKPCVSQDELNDAKIEHIKGGHRVIFSDNPSDYYYFIKTKTFIGNIVYKSYCKRVFKQDNVTFVRILR